MTRRADSLCTAMAPIKAQSAHSRSFSVSFVTLRSTKRFAHSRGSKAATVNRPSGGEDDFLRMILSACLKLQKVSGNSGQINSTFIAFFFLYKCGCGYTASGMLELVTQPKKKRPSGSGEIIRYRNRRWVAVILVQ